MKILTLLASGFEDLEALGTIALLRRAKLDVTMCSVENKYQVTGRYGINVTVDLKISDASKEDYDLLFLPGGFPGVDNLYNEPRVLELVEYFIKNKHLAAICAAPSIPGRMGLLENKNYTCYPGFEETISGKYDNVPVIIDGNLITGRAAGSVIEFAAAIISKAIGPEQSEAMLKSIVYK